MTYRLLECNVDDIGKSGVYSLVRNVIIHNNKQDDIKIDIACINPFEDQADVDELNDYDCQVYFVGAKNSKLLRYYNVVRKTKSLLQHQHYDCVHIHSDIAFKVYPFLKAAKEAGVKKIIVHSHASDVDGKYRQIKGMLHRHYKKYVSNNATQLVSCSHVAAQWMFDQDKQDQVTIINNGIDLKKFAYNADVRQQERQKLGIKDDEVLIGHVGRMAYQKNHEFLVKAFRTFHNQQPQSKLLLVGEGPLKSQIQFLVNSSGLQDSVIFYGTSSQVNDLYQAMDIFALPSHFEGLPISGVEAQAAGLPVVFADTIDREAAITDNCCFLPIREDSNIEDWSNQFSQFAKLGHQNTTDTMTHKGFDISHTVEQFYQLYV